MGLLRHKVKNYKKYLMILIRVFEEIETKLPLLRLLLVFGGYLIQMANMKNLKLCSLIGFNNETSFKQTLAYSEVTFDLKSLSEDTILLEVMVEGQFGALFDVDVLGGNVSKRTQNGAKQIILGKNILHPGLAEKPVTWETEDKSMIISLRQVPKNIYLRLKQTMMLLNLITTLSNAFNNSITGDPIVPKLISKTDKFNENSVHMGSEIEKDTLNKVHVLGPGSYFVV